MHSVNRLSFVLEQPFDCFRWRSAFFPALCVSSFDSVRSSSSSDHACPFLAQGLSLLVYFHPASFPRSRIPTLFHRPDNVAWGLVFLVLFVSWNPILSPFPSLHFWTCNRALPTANSMHVFFSLEFQRYFHSYRNSLISTKTLKLNWKFVSSFYTCEPNGHL